MIIKRDWNENIEKEINSLESLYFNRDEHVDSVKQNFDFRRFYSAEGYDVEINGVRERCVVQMPSNPLRELNDYRKIHCPISADIRRGYYVSYEDSIWIIDTNVANVDGAYLSTRMSRCQYLLRWQDDSGNIIERWAYSSDQTKYSNGEYGNDIFTVGNNQYGLLLPIDEKTKTLKRGMRFVMDFDDAEIPDVYAITNRKIKLNDETYFDRGGTIQIALSFDAFNKDTDRQVRLTNGRTVWICDYNGKKVVTRNEITAIPNGNIVCKGKKRITAGGNAKTFSFIATDNDGDEMEFKNYFWNIDTADEIKHLLNYSVTNENKLKVSVAYDQLVVGEFIFIIVKDGAGNTIVSDRIEIGGGL